MLTMQSHVGDPSGTIEPSVDVSRASSPKSNRRDAMSEYVEGFGVTSEAFVIAALSFPHAGPSTALGHALRAVGSAQDDTQRLPHASPSTALGHALRAVGSAQDDTKVNNAWKSAVSCE